MADRGWTPEPLLGREIFGPLGGIVELGAVSERGTWALPDVSVGAFVARRREELDQILSSVQRIGGFSASTMSIFDALGWHCEHEVTVSGLCLWSGYLETGSDTAGEPAAVRGLVGAAVDLQLTRLTHALVAAAAQFGGDVQTSSELIADVLRRSGRVLGLGPEETVRNAIRMWRVAFLPERLRPDSPLSATDREVLRRHARALGHSLPDSPRPSD